MKVSTKLRSIVYVFFFLLISSSSQGQQRINQPYILILGIAQDGGYPHMGCAQEGCALAWKTDSLKKYVVSFALVDSVTKKWWLFEATPDIKYQMQEFRNLTQQRYNYLPDGIFITHAHIGHYTGLIEFGREVMNTKELPVYVLPRMKTFLENNGPWSQLVSLKNIAIHLLKADSSILLEENIKVEAFTVPHRDEYSETAGFKITAGNKKYLFIPDIDKWGKWNRNIVLEVKSVDYALLDGTFYHNDELPGRKISEVPHPLVTETMDLFKNEDAATKAKLYFIHLNHTNALLWDSNMQGEVKKAGFKLARQGEEL
jgi:pyrroloquinoline quinone biosynthesis protein B